MQWRFDVLIQFSMVTYSCNNPQNDKTHQLSGCLILPELRESHLKVRLSFEDNNNNNNSFNHFEGLSPISST